MDSGEDSRRDSGKDSGKVSGKDSGKEFIMPTEMAYARTGGSRRGCQTTVNVSHDQQPRSALFPRGRQASFALVIMQSIFIFSCNVQRQVVIR